MDSRLVEGRRAELELFAELEVAPDIQIHARVGRRRIAVATSLALWLEVGAILASEAERVGARFLTQAIVDQRLH
jgi:hypothetical protein